MSGIPVFSSGTSLQSSGASVSAQIPADSAGMLPLFVRVTATAAGYFRLSQDGASASIGDLLIQPSDGLILKTCGLSQFSFVSHSGASTVTVTPIDVGGIKYPTNIFTPAALFTTGVNGAWYDPSDFSTLFQDAAGTTPVTAVGQPVGRILDKSGRGNHAFNPSGNSANFPVLSARYNLLTKTEDFSDAVWNKLQTTVTANYSSSPIGDTSADRVVAIGGTPSATYIQQGYATTLGNNVTYVYSVWLKSNTASNQTLRLKNSQLGVVDNFSSNLTVTPDWNRFVFSVTNGASSGTGQAVGIVCDTSNMAFDIVAWGADLRVANDALNQPAYQRVNTATDYDTVGFKPYLAFNGVNQWLQTNSIDFTYGDKMFVSAGVRKLSDAATAIVAEMSANYAGNNGVFALFSPGAANSYQYDLVFKGTAASEVFVNSLTYAAPITNVVSGIGNISAPSATLRVNANQVAQNTTSQGTGNYGNYPMYIGSRAGSSLWFNGRLYGLVVAGKAASANEIASTEAWLNQKTGAY